MAATDEFVEYVMEYLTPVLPVKPKRLFSGTGLYYHQVMFGAILDNTLYFVVDDTTRGKYQAAGMKPFTYSKKAGSVTIGRFYELPEETLTDRIDLEIWMKEAVSVAQKTKKAKRSKKVSKG